MERGGGGGVTNNQVHRADVSDATTSTLGLNAKRLSCEEELNGQREARKEVANLSRMAHYSCR